MRLILRAVSGPQTQTRSAALDELIAKCDALTDTTYRVIDKDDRIFDAVKAVPLMKSNIRLLMDAMIENTDAMADEGTSKRDLYAFLGVCYSAQELIDDIRQEYDDLTADAQSCPNMAALTARLERLARSRAHVELLVRAGAYDPRKAHHLICSCAAAAMDARRLLLHARSETSPDSQLCLQVQAMHDYTVKTCRDLWEIFLDQCLMRQES